MNANHNRHESHIVQYQNKGHSGVLQKVHSIARGSFQCKKLIPTLIPTVVHYRLRLRSFCCYSFHKRTNMDPNTEERGRKRSRSTTKAHDDGKAQLSNIDALSLASVSEPISPPAKKQREDEVLQANVPASTTHTDHAGKYVIASPFQLTHVTALPNSTNVDALKLSDLVGDPLIRDCWAFNYLFDVDFLMWV